MTSEEASFGQGSKEIVSVSLVSDHIVSSVHSLLVSPRNGHGSATTPTYTRTQSSVLSPWSSCVSHTLESSSPLSGVITPNTAPSTPDLTPNIVPPPHTSIRFPLHCSLSPTRNRFHSSPKADDSSCFVFDLKSIPDLESDETRSSTSVSERAALLTDAKVEGETVGQGFFGVALSQERKASSPKVQFLYTGSKPPKPPRSLRRGQGKADPGAGSWKAVAAGAGGPLGKVRFPQTLSETFEMPFSVICCILLGLFIVLMVYGGSHRH